MIAQQANAIYSLGDGTFGSGAYLIVSELNTTAPTHIEKEKQTIYEYKLYGNYPNPFNPATTIKYDLPEASFITLKIYTINGQEVKTLVSNNMQPGNHSVTWDATDKSGVKVSSGIYIFTIKTNTGYVESNKMILLK